MAPPGEDLILHETTLTAQYGMSRTPIRQILQRLAYERLVETKSGVGTVVVAMAEDNRNRDLVTHRGILQAVLLHQLPPLTIAQHSDILALAGMASMLEDEDRDLHYDLRNRMHALLAEVIPDPILRDTFSASFWRVVRWHMQDLASDKKGAAETLRNLIRHIAGYTPRDSTDLFRCVIDGELAPAGI
ncbi:GntR family transcriptional regulator [Labrenzia aggregata]|uniref:GntR family transcriptional regulator n=2 Tax=Roseibium aggregatum TaxID=187304 RepID=A0A939EHX1_9HYPH|nr:GntR family transcriptional regulator [Roseibium aggregatum]